uniref:Uncharacterized protein n=1 Tax=Arundo donax TaxID=35708 RepID=A0A0A9FV10_ARUDO
MGTMDPTVSTIYYVSGVTVHFFI